MQKRLRRGVVKAFVRGKTVPRCILISDVSGLAGLPPGHYRANHGDVELLDDGRLVVAGQRQILAGASLPLGAGVANVIRFAEVDLADAVRMAVHHPAGLLGLGPGGLEPGEKVIVSSYQNYADHDKLILKHNR